MSGPRFDLKTVNASNAYKERIRREHCAAKHHQMHAIFSNYGERGPGAGHPVPKVPASNASETASSRSITSSRFTEEMQRRLEKLESTIAEERKGRENVQEQLDRLKQLLVEQPPKA